MKNRKLILFIIAIIIGTFLGSKLGKKLYSEEEPDGPLRYTNAYNLDRSNLPNGKTRLTYFYRVKGNEYKRVTNIQPDQYSFKAQYLVSFPSNKPDEGEILLEQPFERGSSEDKSPEEGWEVIPEGFVPINP